MKHDHPPTPGVMREDNYLWWGEACVTCGGRLKAVSIYSKKYEPSGHHFWAHADPPPERKAA